MDNINPQFREAMITIEPTVADVMTSHLSAQEGKLWMPSELIPKDHEFPDLPPELGGLLVLNLLTEDGLPYFLALLVNHLGDRGAFYEWSKLWTAEEDRHGSVLKQYLHNSISREQMIAVERMQYEYLRHGFWPHWSRDPFKLLAYVVIQEKATQESHATVGIHAREADDVLANIMFKIAGEEAAHHRAYYSMFEALLKIEPSHAIVALDAVAKSFDMPGYGIPGFKKLSQLQERTRAFSTLKLHGILTNVWDKLSIGSLTGLVEKGEKARDAFHTYMTRIGTIGERRANRKPSHVDLPVFNKTVFI